MFNWCLKRKGVQSFEVVVDDDAGGDEEEGEDVPFDDGVDEY